MVPDTATFEVRHRGRKIATFTGSRETARAVTPNASHISPMEYW